MVSVPSDVTSSIAHQAPSPRPARLDPSPKSDSFGALVDSNIPAEPPGPPQAASQRPGSRSSTSSESPAPRDTAPDRSSPSHQADKTTDAGPADRSSPAESSSSDNKIDPSAQKDGKTAETTSTDKSAKDSAQTTHDASAADATGVAQPDAIVPTVPDPVAIVVPVAIPATVTPDASTNANGPQQPLAIAAAALAASSAAMATGSSSGDAFATPDKTNTGAPATTAQISAQAATLAAASKPTAAPGGVVTEQTVATDATTATETPMAAVINGSTAIGDKAAPAKAATPGQGKGLAKAAGTTTAEQAKATAATEIGSDGASLQPGSVAKPDGTLTAAGAAKPDVSASATPADAALASHDHASPTPTAQASPAGSDPSLQAPTTFQPQVQSTTSMPSAANLTATQTTSAPVPLSGLAVEIAAAAHSGKTRFDVRLDPADLGRIDVRIDVNRNGQVTSHLTVEKPETLSMLQQDASQLRQALDDAGLKTGNGGLQFSLRDQSSSGQNNGDQAGRNAQRLVIHEDENAPVAVAGRSYGRMLGSSGGVDIRV